MAFFHFTRLRQALTGQDLLGNVEMLILEFNNVRYN